MNQLSNIFNNNASRIHLKQGMIWFMFHPITCNFIHFNFQPKLGLDLHQVLKSQLYHPSVLSLNWIYSFIFLLWLHFFILILLFFLSLFLSFVPFTSFLYDSSAMLQMLTFTMMNERTTLYKMRLKNDRKSRVARSFITSANADVDCDWSSKRWWGERTHTTEKVKKRHRVFL